MPCGLWVDMERARLARRGVTEMQNAAARGRLSRLSEVESPLGSADAFA
jgi:hypothetical protein